MNASDDKEIGIVLGHQNDQLEHVMLHYIQSRTKSGHDLEFRTIHHPERSCNFPGAGR